MFLLENLKFYPAELGRDAQLPKPPQEEEINSEEDEAENEDTTGADETLATGGENEKADETAAEGNENAEEAPDIAENDGAETQEEEETKTLVEGEEADESLLQESSDPDNLDKLMFQLMPQKTVAEYIDDLSECGDVFVNDDIKDIDNRLTSIGGFNCKRKMCGLQLKDFITKYDSDSVYKMFAVSWMSPAPREGEIDTLLL